MKIGLVRRGYSSTGGAESYLRRLADALEVVGHEAVLFSTPNWPRDRWPVHRRLVSVSKGSPARFARGVARLAGSSCDRLFSLERLWKCDCYRAGDGVHRAWLERRAQFSSRWQTLFRRWNPKHRQILALEKSLFARHGARTIIANSRLVRDEIVRYYGTPAERIAIVYNGLPANHFAPPAVGQREQARAVFGLEPEDYAILFAGTGWERKGLGHALAAVARLPERPRPRLLVTGQEIRDRFCGGYPGGGWPGELSRGGRGHGRLLCRRRRVRGAHALRSVFQRLPGSPGCRVAGFDDPGQRVCGDHRTRPRRGCFRAGGPRRRGDLATLLTSWADPVRRESARVACRRKAVGFTIEKNVGETLEILLRQECLGEASLPRTTGSRR